MKIGAWIVSVVAAFALGGFLGSKAGFPPLFVGSSSAMASELRLVLAESDPLKRAMRMDRLFAHLDDENLPGAIEVYREAALRGEVIGMVRFLGRWSEIDNQGLIDSLGDWPDEQSQAQGYGWAVYRMTLEKGVAPAAKFYEELPPRFLFSTRYWLVDGAISAGAIGELTDWVATQGEADDRRRIAAIITRRLLGDSSDAMVRWFEEIPDNAGNGFKATAFGVVLERLAISDPESAIALRESHLDDAYARKSAMPLAMSWLSQDASAAVSWAESLPEAAERDRVLNAIVERWSLKDVPAAVAWLDAQTPRPALDGLYAKVAQSLVSRRPEAASQFAARIHDPEQRRSALMALSRYWFKRNPDDLRVWLAAGGMSSSESDAVIEDLERKRRRIKSRQAGSS